LAITTLMVAAPALAQTVTLGVNHGWSSPSEMAALKVLQDHLKAEGIGWKDVQVVAHDTGSTVSIMNMIAGGNPPDVFMASGFDPGLLKDLRDQNYGVSLTDFYKSSGATAHFPPTVLQATELDGDIVKAPLNVHIDGMLYWNTDVAKKAGVDPTANEYFVSGTGPGMVGVLDSGGAEVVAGYVPYVADMELKKIGRVLFTGSDAIGRAAPGDGFIASTRFIKEHPEAVKDLLRAQFAATDYIKSNPNEAYKSMAEFAKVDEAAVRYSFEKNLIGVAPSYVPDVDGIVATVAVAQELGFAPKDVDLPTYAKKFENTALAKEVLAKRP